MQKQSLQIPLDFIKASIGETYFKCGKNNCCCNSGELHTAFYLSYRLKGKSFTVHIPKFLVKDFKKRCQSWKKINHRIEVRTHKIIIDILKSHRIQREKNKK